MKSTNLLVFMTAAVLLPSVGFAQEEEEQLAIPVRVWGSAYGRAAYGEIFSVSAYGTGYVPVSPSDSTGATFSEYADTFSWSMAKVWISTPKSTTLRMQFGKEDLVSIDADGQVCDWVKLTVAAPEGYTAQIDGIHRPMLSGAAWSHQFRVRIVAKSFPSVGDSLPVGGASSLSSGVTSPGTPPRMSWDAGLGTLLNGEPAGSMRVLSHGYDSSWTPFFTPGGLYYQSASDEVQVYRVSNLIRQVVAPQAVVDVVTITSTSYEVRFYNPADASTSGWPRTFTGSPFITYKLEQGGTSTTLKITSTTSTRTAVTTLARSGTWPAFTWTTKDWNTSGQTQLTEQVRQNTTGSADRNEQVLVRVPSGATAIEAKNGYTFYSWGEELTTQTLGTSNPLTTTYTYYDNSSDAANHRYLKSVVQPGGGWEAYEYWDPTGNDGYTGRLKRTYRPWVSSPSTVTLNPALGEVTYFEYGVDPFGMYSRPTLVETKVNNVLTAKTTTAYTNVSGTTNGMNLVEAVSTSYAASASTLASTTRFYREDVATAFFRGQVHSVASPGAIKVSYARQRGTWNGSSFTKSGNNGLDPGPASRVAVITGTGSTGTLYQTHDGYDIEDLRLLTNQSTMDVTIRNSRALVVRTETHVWNGTAWAEVAAVNYAYNSAALLTTRTGSNGSIHEIGWTGELKTSETDEAGVVNNYTYDYAGRLKDVTKASGPTTTFTCNAAGLVTAEVLSKSGETETITVSRAFDNAGRLSSETPPNLSATTFSYNPSARSQTSTAPDGGTRTETYLLDGRLEKTTGTAVVEQFFSYAVETDGRRRTQVNIGSASSPRWAKTWTDWLGRTVQEDAPTFNGGGTATRTHAYDSAGRLWKTTQPGMAPALRTYDALGNLATEGVDFNSSNALDTNSSERIRVYSTVFAQRDGAWWLKKTESAYPIVNDPNTIKELGRTETKLTSLGTNRLSHVESFDVFGNKVLSYTEVNRSTKTLTAWVDAPDSTTNAYRKSVNGLLVEAEDSAGVLTTFGYDFLDRPTTTTHERTASQGASATTAYVYGTARTWKVTDIENVVQATYTYDTTGRVSNVKNGLNQYAYFSYNVRNQKTREWGHNVVPVEYVFDDTYGHQVKMKTFRAGTGWSGATWPTSPGDPDYTKWVFDDATGLLKDKYDAANLNTSGEPIASPKKVSYNYTAAGQIASRTGARGVVATYGYSSTTGELTGVSYSNDPESTPAITYTYNRLGRAATVTDVTGQRSFTYNLSNTLELQREDLPSYYGTRRLTYEYDTATGSKGRPNAFKLGTSGNPTADQSATYSYQAVGRLSGIVAGGQSFVYTYTTNSNLIESTVNTTLGYTDVRSYHAKRDWLGTRETKWSTTTKAKFAYTQDSIGRVTEVAKTGEMFNRYGTGNAGLTTYYTYTDRGELFSEITKLGSTSTVLTGRNDTEYEYDNIGNRKKVTHNGFDFTYTANKLNQYESRTVPRVFDVAGASTAGTVTVSSPQPPASTSQPAVTRHGEYFFQGRLFDGSAAFFTDITVYDGSSAYLKAFLQATPEVPTYDDDGNLKTDGRWSYTYDAENRLIAMQTNTSAIPNADKRRLEFTYDFLGRRVQKKVRAGYNGSSYTTVVSDEKFVWNGWLTIAKLNAGTNALVASYFWGLDVTGTMQGAAGVGGLLMTQEGGYNYLPAYDALGNVHAMLQATGGTLAACYEYDAFGQILRASGSYAETNPFRFSTKFTDGETGLVYYGLRYYSPALGRFITRDPIAEQGGLNLYGFCGNDGVNHWDYLGQSWFSKLFKKINRALHKVVRSGLPFRFMRTWDRKLEAWEIKHYKELKIAAAIVASFYTFGAASTWAMGAMSTTTAAGVTTFTVAGTAISATTAGVIAGVVGGAAAGAVGGTIMTGTVKGALQGALAGALTGGVDSYFGGAWSATRLVSTGVAGGVGAEIMGGEFKTGFAFAFAANAARAFYETVVKFEIDPGPGGPARQKDEFTHPFPKTNNIGTQGGPIENPKFYAEGGTLPRILNRVPGINAAAGLHDVFQINLGGGWPRYVFNFPGMPIAGAITYSGLMAGMPSVYLSLPSNGRNGGGD